MENLSAKISLTDQMSMVFSNINMALNSVIQNFKTLEKASNNVINTSSFNAMTQSITNVSQAMGDLAKNSQTNVNIEINQSGITAEEITAQINNIPDSVYSTVEMNCSTVENATSEIEDIPQSVYSTVEMDYSTVENATSEIDDIPQSVYSAVEMDYSTVENAISEIEDIPQSVYSAVEMDYSSVQQSLSSMNDLTTSIQNATNEMSNFNHQALQSSQNVGGITRAFGNAGKTIGGVVLGATSGVVAGIGGAVKVGKQFESSMSQVSATMGMSAEEANYSNKEYALLANTAKEMGASTKYSASEAADALNYLALAGYDANKASKALPKILTLAQAGGMGLARASDMVTDSMNALEIEATSDNLTSFGDKLAKASQKSNTSVAQLGDAILTVGGTAKNLKGGTTELATSLGILADSGIKASEGGTALRNIIMSLTPTTDAAINAFESMGIRPYDKVTGEFKSLEEIFSALNSEMEYMTDEEKTYTLNDIFNKTDLKSVSALMSATATNTTQLKNALQTAEVDINSFGVSIDDLVSSFDKTQDSEVFISKAMKDFGLNSEQAGILYTGLMSVVDGSATRWNELSGYIENSEGAMQKMADTMNDNLEGDLFGLNSALESVGVEISEKINAPIREAVQFTTEQLRTLSSEISQGSLSSSIENLGITLSIAIQGIATIILGLMPIIISIVDTIISTISEMIPYIVDIFNAIIDAINVIMPYVSEAISFVLNAIVSLMPYVSEAIQTVLNLVMQIGSYIVDNWSLIEPIVIGITGAIITYKAVLLLTKIAIEGVTIVTNALTIAQRVLHTVLLSNPIALIASIITGVLLVALAKWIQKVGSVKIAWLIAMDSIQTAIESISLAMKKMFNSVSNILDNLKLIFAIAKTSIINHVSNMKVKVLQKVQDMINGIISAINDFINLLNKIPGVSIQALSEVTIIGLDQIEQVAKDQSERQLQLMDMYNQNKIARENREKELQDLEDKYKDAQRKRGYKIKEAQIEDFINRRNAQEDDAKNNPEPKLNTDEINVEELNLDEIINNINTDALNGVNGDAKGNKIDDTAKKGGGDSAKKGTGGSGKDAKDNPTAKSNADANKNTADNTASTAGSAKSIEQSIDVNSEDLKYLRDIAERDIINRFTTAEIKVDMTNNNNIKYEKDIDEMIEQMTRKIQEQMQGMAEGVHI